MQVYIPIFVQQFIAFYALNPVALDIFSSVNFIIYTQHKKYHPYSHQTHTLLLVSLGMQVEATAGVGILSHALLMEATFVSFMD